MSKPLTPAKRQEAVVRHILDEGWSSTEAIYLFVLDRYPFTTYATVQSDLRFLERQKVVERRGKLGPWRATFGERAQ